MVETFLFEFDGVVVDARAGVQLAINETARRYGWAPLAAVQWPEGLRGGAGAMMGRLALAARGGGCPIALAEDAWPSFELDFSLHCATSTREVPGARRALEKIACRGARTAIVTHAEKALVHRALVAHDLAVHFSAIIGSEVAAPPLSYAALIRRAMVALDADPQRTVLVGGSARHVLAARAVGIGAWLLDGREEGGAAQGIRPDRRIASLDALAALLERGGDRSGSARRLLEPGPVS